MIKHIPNILTVLRFVLIYFIAKAINDGNYIASIILFTLSGVTDVLDGFIARKFDAISNFGKLMDPLADKLTQLTILACLVFNNVIPLWILVIILIKETILITGAAFLYGKDVVVYSRWYGKAATCLLYLAIVSSMVIKQFNLGHSFIVLEYILYSIAIIMTCISLVMYIYDLYHKGILDKTDITKKVNSVNLKKEEK